MAAAIKTLQVEFLEDLEIGQGPAVENQLGVSLVRLFKLFGLGYCSVGLGGWFAFVPAARLIYTSGLRRF